uniref:Uncharacterized protein n=1 Tax=Rhizophora mucronata TaxID=61149 RepID=A0A2P2QKM9_RHIMU
MISTPSLQN